MVELRLPKARENKAFITLAVIVILCLGALLYSCTSAEAHSGGLANDGCHNDKAEGNRHFHAEGSRETAGLCVEIEAGTAKVPFDAIEKLATHDTVEVIPKECAEAIARVADTLQESFYIGGPEELDLARDLQRNCIN